MSGAMIALLVLLLLVVVVVVAAAIGARRSAVEPAPPGGPGPLPGTVHAQAGLIGQPGHPTVQPMVHPTVKGSKPKVRVVSVNGGKHVPKAPPPAKKTVKAPGTGSPAHVTQVMKVPAFCPLCGRVDRVDGCPGTH